MPSSFGWLDVDDEQRRRMQQVVQLFKQEGTIDELGIGSVRDAIADRLFPGTSVLHTRLRYLLLIPWALAEANQWATQPDRAVQRLRSIEVRTIHALLRGSAEHNGIIGSTAKAGLRRMPSAAYWAALRRYGVVTLDTSITGWFRQSTRSAHATEEGERVGDRHRSGLHLDLPLPPHGWDKECSLELEPDEAEFLRERLTRSVPGSLLSWLATNADYHAEGSVQLWEHPHLAKFPTDIQEIIDNARRVHVVYHGAVLLYNLMLAEKQSKDQECEYYRESLVEWEQELDTEHPLERWDRARLWEIVATPGRSAKPGIRAFFDNWCGIVESGRAVADDTNARSLVRNRERALKGSRSRFDNPAALDAWSGESGLSRLTYRWPVASALLGDLHNPKGT